MPDIVLESLDIVPVRWVDEVMELALVSALKPTKKASSPKTKKPSKSQTEAILPH